jgi:hypothetical protein
MLGYAAWLATLQAMAELFCPFAVSPVKKAKPPDDRDDPTKEPFNQLG